MRSTSLGAHFLEARQLSHTGPAVWLDRKSSSMYARFEWEKGNFHHGHAVADQQANREEIWCLSFRVRSQFGCSAHFQRNRFQPLSPWLEANYVQRQG